MKLLKKKPTSHSRTTARRSSQTAHATSPFVEHLHELRRRLYYIAVSVLIWGAATYAIQQRVVNFLLRPARGQNFIYTSPGGGIDFLFRICIYSGLIFSLPIIIYNSLRFLEPLLSLTSRRYVVWGSLISGLLALGGMVFGYYLGLPAALHFLLHQFTTAQIRPLITIQSYLSFVIVYMVGSALLFQLPLFLIIINRIRPLKPRKLLHYERWVILVAFILSGLMNPTPNLISQSIIIVPFILMYQLGILLIAVVNRKKKPTATQLLYEKDLQAQAARLAAARQLAPLSQSRPIVYQSRVMARPSPAAASRFPQSTLQSVDGMRVGDI